MSASYFPITHSLKPVKWNHMVVVKINVHILRNNLDAHVCLRYCICYIIYNQTTHLGMLTISVSR